MGSGKGSDNDGASPGKIFIGGLAMDTTLETFTKYSEKYGEITDFVTMKDRHTGRPRGFRFITLRILLLLTLLCRRIMYWQTSPAAGFGVTGGLYGSITGYGGSGRYHPYAR